MGKAMATAPPDLKHLNVEVQFFFLGGGGGWSTAFWVYIKQSSWIIISSFCGFICVYTVSLSPFIKILSIT